MATENKSHQEIGNNQKLTMFHHYSPGSCFFLPHGTRIYNRLIEFLRNEYFIWGFEEVITPQLFHKELWEISGHWEKYRQNMFTLAIPEHESEDTSAVEPDHAFKAMNCPAHCLMFASTTRSYKNLPLRLADFGVLHRNELSGTLRGLTRVRKFSQDDGHIFCREDQIGQEVTHCLEFIKYVYGIFGFPPITSDSDQNFFLELSTRPEKYIGSLEVWEKAETTLAEILDKLGFAYQVNPGDGAFYGPKIDIHIADAIGRKHQCATIQLDFNLPQRFQLEYDSPSGKQRPVIIHRAIFGSLERFLGILMEHTQGYWPFWLSPRQVMILPAKPISNDYASQVYDRVREKGFYADIDISDNTLDKKIALAESLTYNYIVVVGKREETNKTITVRDRQRKQEVKQLETFLIELKKQRKSYQ